jgi:hypothetical protein
MAQNMTKFGQKQYLKCNAYSVCVTVIFTSLIELFKNTHNYYIECALTGCITGRDTLASRRSIAISRELKFHNRYIFHLCYYVVSQRNPPAEILAFIMKIYACNLWTASRKP